MAKGTLSQNGYLALKKEEGYKPKAYRLNGEQYCTCCLGHYGPDVQCGRTYTDAECKAFFAKDSDRFTKDVNKIFDTNKGMTQNMFDAMFIFAYNHGNISDTQLGRTISADPTNFAAIQRVWERSYCSGRYSKVLTARRKREAMRFCGSAYSSSPMTGGESYGSGDENENNSGAWQYEPNVYQDNSYGVSDVDYAEINKLEAYATDKSDETYKVFTIIQDASNAAVGAKELEISTMTHPEGAEDHALIEDDAIKPAIMQDEHSEKVKEDTDYSEGIDKPGDAEVHFGLNGIPEGGGPFSI